MIARRARLLAALALPAFVTAVAATAMFDVQPNGNASQGADGSLVLTDGGRVVDTRHGFEVDGRYLEVKEGEYLRGKGVSIRSASVGSIRADKLEYDVKGDTLAASGNLSFSSGEVQNLRASRLVAFPNAAVVVASGQVTAKQAERALSADQVVVDARRKLVFLYGHYAFDAGAVHLSTRGTASPATASLLLDFTGAKARPKIPAPAADRDRFLGYVARAK